MVQFEPKTCAVCGKRMRPHKNDIPSWFRRRKCCGVQCADVLRRGGIQGRRCAVCRGPLDRHPHESIARYMLRRCCSRKCADLYRANPDAHKQRARNWVGCAPLPEEIEAWKQVLAGQPPATGPYQPTTYRSPRVRL